MCNGDVRFFVASRRRHTRCSRDWSSDVCSSDLMISWPAVAAVLVLLAGALVWGGVAQSNAGHFQADATSYQQFLHALGGKDVRVATLAARGSQVIQGSAVLYDSDRGQSWALVMAHAPGYS